MTPITLLFCGLTLFYFVYHLSFFLYFFKVKSDFFDRRQQILHLCLMWGIPFIWILILKIIIRPNQERHRSTTSPTNNNDENNRREWFYPFYSFFHSSFGEQSQTHAEVHGHFHDFGEHHHGGDIDSSSHH